MIIADARRLQSITLFATSSPIIHRNSIATKVAAKKTAKGYTVSDERCTTCEMPLMTMNGKSECKTCPAIKKWVQRQNEAEGYTQHDDARDATEERVEGYAEGREGAPVDVVAEDELRVVCSDEKSERVLSVKASGSNESEDSEDTEAIRARAREIIMNARKRGGWDADEVKEEEKSIKSAQSPIKSAQLSWDEPKMSYSKESNDEDYELEDRAADIIRRARENLKTELGPGGYPQEILSPRVDNGAGGDALKRAAEKILSPRGLDPSPYQSMDDARPLLSPRMDDMNNAMVCVDTLYNNATLPDLRLTLLQFLCIECHHRTPSASKKP